jgi:glutathione S-transferase
MFTIWGRANSVNVQKVLWCCEELGLPYERIDAGLHFGRNGEANYLAMNPNGRVPTLVDGDFVLWESNSIIRYLCMQYAPASTLYPSDPKQRASVDRWLDWVLTTLQPAERDIFWGYVRTPAAQRDMAALQTAAVKLAEVWRIIDKQLEGRGFLETEHCTLADIVLAAYARRWYGIEDKGLERPALPNVERWYSQMGTRAGFRRYIALPLT